MLHLYLGIRSPLREDGPEYLGIAESLAHGDGYHETTGPWPDVPHTKRPPAWPVFLVPAMWITPQPWHSAAVRVTALVPMALTGVVFYFLCLHFGVNRRLAAFSGLFAACSLPMIALAYDGMSEGLAALFCSAGILFVLWGGRRFYAGAFFLSAAVMVRTNLILLPVFVAAALLLSHSGRRTLWLHRKRVLMGSLIFFSLPTVWMIRNYAVTHRAFLLSSGDGEVLYGGNNDVVANELEFWGYWIEPDSRLGEPPLHELAISLSDVQLNDYYRGKGTAWIRSHIRELPRLWLGKLIRGFVPLPWRPLAASYIAFGYRALLDILFFATMSRWRPRLDPQYALILGSLFVTTLLTTVLYWGVYRFVHCFVELFFIPLIAVGLERDQPSPVELVAEEGLA